MILIGMFEMSYAVRRVALPRDRASTGAAA